MTYNANFPVSADVLANPSNLTNRDDPGFELHGVISRIQDILEALEAKVGIGSSTPGASAAVLRRTAAGASAWGLVGPNDLNVQNAASAGSVLRGTGTTTMSFNPLQTGDIQVGAISQWVTSSGTGGDATNSATPRSIAGTPVNLTTGGGLVLVVVTGNAYCNTAGGLTQYTLAQNGGAIGGSQAIASQGASTYHGFSLAAVVQPTAGTYSYSVLFSTVAGVATTLGGCTLYAIEIRR